MGSVQEYLSSDIVFEILSRVTSLKTLDTCKSVSKLWKNIICESSFTQAYCQRTNNVLGYFLQGFKHNKYSSMFVSISNDAVCMESLGRDTRILASCNQGILCCERKFRNLQCRYYACKPTTKQWQPLPNPKTRYRTTAVAIMVLRSHPLRYIIIRLSRRGYVLTPLNQQLSVMYRCEKFDSEIWGWKEEGDDVVLAYSEMFNFNPAVSASNSVHWLTSEDNVVAYNAGDSNFHIFPLPEAVKENQSKRLVEYQGKLGFMCLTTVTNLHLWTISDLKNHTWEKMKTIVLNIENIERVLSFPSPEGFYNADIAFFKGYFNEVGFYKLQDCSFKSVKLDDSIRRVEDIFQFKSDLDPINLRCV